MDKFVEKVDLDKVSSQTLAFIGDAVYNVYIRTYLAALSSAKTGKLHVKSIHYVSAKAQARTLDLIYDILNEDEVAVYKRGRNTNISTVSKNVDVVSYKKATGFEALIGYLYLTKNIERLDFIIDESIARLNEVM